MSLNEIPNELIESIADNLHYVDLCNLLQVNSRFNTYLTNSNGLWQRLFCKQWPTLYEEILAVTEMDESDLNWRLFTIQRHRIKVKVYKTLSQLSERQHQNMKLKFVCKTELVAISVINELKIIIYSDNTKYDSMIRCYARAALLSIDQYDILLCRHFKRKFLKLMRMQNLEIANEK